jgi:hypothetical protein
VKIHVLLFAWLGNGSTANFHRCIGYTGSAVRTRQMNKKMERNSVTTMYL